MNHLLAYIDPATTAIIWQVVAGVLITMGVIFGIWWRKITTFIKGVWVKIFGKKNTDETAAADDEALDEISDDELDEISDAEGEKTQKSANETSDTDTELETKSHK